MFRRRYFYTASQGLAGQQQAACGLGTRRNCLRVCVLVRTCTRLCRSEPLRGIVCFLLLSLRLLFAL